MPPRALVPTVSKPDALLPGSWATGIGAHTRGADAVHDGRSVEDRFFPFWTALPVKWAEFCSEKGPAWGPRLGPPGAQFSSSTPGEEAPGQHDPGRRPGAGRPCRVEGEVRRCCSQAGVATLENTLGKLAAGGVRGRERHEVRPQFHAGVPGRSELSWLAWPRRLASSRCGSVSTCWFLSAPCPRGTGRTFVQIPAL